MLRFQVFLENKVKVAPLTQTYKLMMKRPTPLFKDENTIKLPKPEKNTSDALKMELDEVIDAMVLSPEQDEENKKIDKEYINMMKDIVKEEGASKTVLDFVDEIKRQVDTNTIKMKYQYNRARPDAIAKFHGKKLTAKVDVDTPGYPSNHTITGYVISGILSEMFPNVTEKLNKIAERNAASRVELGVHFPSDVEAGEIYAEELLKRLNRDELPEVTTQEEEMKPRKKYKYSDLPAHVYGKEAY